MMSAKITARNIWEDHGAALAPLHANGSTAKAAVEAVKAETEAALAARNLLTTEAVVP